jgi:hypothetical protein
MSRFSIMNDYSLRYPDAQDSRVAAIAIQEKHFHINNATEAQLAEPLAETAVNSPNNLLRLQ